MGEKVSAGVGVGVDQAPAADVQRHDLQHPSPEGCYRIEGVLLHFRCLCGVRVLVDRNEEDRLSPIGAEGLDELVLGFLVELFAGPDQGAGWWIGFE